MKLSWLRDHWKGLVAGASLGVTTYLLALTLSAGVAILTGRWEPCRHTQVWDGTECLDAMPAGPDWIMVDSHELAPDQDEGEHESSICEQQIAGATAAREHADHEELER